MNQGFGRFYRWYVLLIAFLALGLAVLVVVNSGLNFGGQAARAGDDQQGLYVYAPVRSGFVSVGKVYQYDIWRAQTASDAYVLSNSKQLTELKFSAEALPANSSIRFCVEQISERNQPAAIFCQTFAASGSTQTWEQKFPNGIALSVADYQCSAELYVPETVTMLSAPQFSCEFRTQSFASAESAQKRLLAFAPLQQWQQGSELLGGLSYKLTNAARAEQVYFEVSAAAGVQNQDVYDICLQFSGGLTRQECFANVSIEAGVASSSLRNVQQLELDLPANTTVTATCRTQAGLLARCNLHLELSGADLSAAIEVQGQSGYCTANLYAYQNGVDMRSLATESLKVSRCEALL